MKEVISEKAAKIVDLLEQIDAVNKQIQLHQDDPFMKDQYQDRKDRFIKELVKHLGEFDILPEDLIAA